MEDVVEVSRHVDELRDVVVGELEVLIGEQVLDVGEVARDEVVHPDDVTALLEEAVAQMGAEKAGGAGDEDAFASHVV